MPSCPLAVSSDFFGNFCLPVCYAREPTVCSHVPVGLANLDFQPKAGQKGGFSKITSNARQIGRDQVDAGFV
jgi:hypothetical protein